MREAVATFVIAFLIFFTTFGAYVLVMRHVNQQQDLLCAQSFGTEWKGKTSVYGPDICVNAKGEVKYTQ